MNLAIDSFFAIKSAVNFLDDRYFSYVDEEMEARRETSSNHAPRFERDEIEN
ncbi:hypothetical protein C1H46_038061 [Malus baccata]|uniref:Uncharacterized protein n=1 Tax=Malus baccata TaxID=106549 RepID=A0A540KQB4_MALBA|nr:hypothetical protein C1H46_038061 [Malus baccata]